MNQKNQKLKNNFFDNLEIKVKDFSSTLFNISKDIKNEIVNYISNKQTKINVDIIKEYLIKLEHSLKDDNFLNNISDDNISKASDKINKLNDHKIKCEVISIIFENKKEIIYFVSNIKIDNNFINSL